MSIAYYSTDELRELALPAREVTVLRLAIRELRTIESNMLIETAQIEQSLVQIKDALARGLHLSAYPSKLPALAEQRRMQVSHIQTIIAMITDPLDDEDAPFYQPDLGRTTRDAIYRIVFERKPQEDPK